MVFVSPEKSHISQTAANLTIFYENTKETQAENIKRMKVNKTNNNNNNNLITMVYNK